MNAPEKRIATEKAARDAALALFKADLAQIQADLRTRSLTGRIATRLGEGASDLGNDAADIVRRNPGKLAAAIIASALWLARKPLLDWLESRLPIAKDSDNTEPGSNWPD